MYLCLLFTQPILRLKLSLVGWLCIVLLANSFDAHAQINAGIDFDLQEFIDDAVEAGETHIVIPPGRYRVQPQSSTHLLLQNLENITIEAVGVEMICTETTRALSIYNCKDLKIVGLTIDYDPLPYTQGRIVALSEDKRTLTVDLIEGYPEADSITNHKVEIFDEIDGELATTTYYNIEITVDGPQRIVITKPSNYGESSSKEAIGDIVVIGAESGSTIPHAIVADQSTSLVFADMTLYASNSFGFLETNCSSSRYDNCKVDRRPLDTDLKDRGHRRLRSLNADAFHSKKASIGPTYIECLARYMGDDGIAINGDYHLITASNGTTLRILAKLGNPLNLTVNDTAELVSYTGERIADAIITDIQIASSLTDAEKQFVNNQSLSGRIREKTRDASHAYTVTLDRSVDLPMGSLIASSNRLGNGFEIRDCTIGPNRSRGILVKASDGKIIGNHLIDNWGQAIKVAPEYYWLEAGSSNDIIIAGNTITGCHDAGIAVHANGGDGNVAPAGAHSNIQVTANSISHSTNPAIAVTATSGLTLFNNTVEHPNNDLLANWILNNFGRNEDPLREIFLENIEGLKDSASGHIEAWRGLYGLAMDGSDDFKDLSGDGRPAMFSLIFNLGNPREINVHTLNLDVPEEGGLPLITNQPDLALHYIRMNDSAQEMDFICEFSLDLAPNGWSPIENLAHLYDSIHTVPISDSKYELVTVMLKKDFLSKGFFRVNVERE